MRAREHVASQVTEDAALGERADVQRYSNGYYSMFNIAAQLGGGKFISRPV